MDIFSMKIYQNKIGSFKLDSVSTHFTELGAKQSLIFPSVRRLYKTMRLYPVQLSSFDFLTTL